MSFEPLTEAARNFKLGEYEHFKGNRYTALYIARHSETGEEMVVYREEYGDKIICVRPLAMFIEEIERDGKRMPRFKYVGSVGA